MDPYLEDPSAWRDFHGRFIYALSEVLMDRLPPLYLAKVEEDVRPVEVLPQYPAFPVANKVRPDVAVVRQNRPAVRTGSAGGGTATLEPVTIRVPAEEEVKERWIEIVHRPDDSLVTVIEVLSPTNKGSEGYDDYREKRRRILRQDTNLVELDLLVAGRRVDPPESLPAGDYFGLVSRAGRPGLRDVYAWSVRWPLPQIRVPLRAPDDDVLLDLAGAFTTAFDRGRYDRWLPYHLPLFASLRSEDAEWAKEVARAVGPQ